MANTTLSTTTATGSAQSATQNPQSATASSSFGGGQPTSSVQPGTSTSLLENSHGTLLNSTPLTTIPLTGASSTAKVIQAPVEHHVDVGLVLVALVLVVAAATLFVLPAITDKNTTN